MTAKRRPDDRRKCQRRAEKPTAHTRIKGQEGRVPIYRRSSGQYTSSTRENDRRTGPEERRKGPEERREGQMGIKTDGLIVMKKYEFLGLGGMPSEHAEVPKGDKIRREYGLGEGELVGFRERRKRRGRRKTDGK